MKRNYLALLITAVCSSHVLAQEALAPITVSASREDHALRDLASNAAVVGKKEIATQQSETLRDALRYTPGVDMDGFGRYEGQDITIRGVSGNRVKLTLDGLPMPDQFSFGPYQNAGRAYFDTSNVERVEVIRGPISSLHGASALGGVVSLVTRSPKDFLKPDARFGGEVSAEYLGKNNAKRVSGTGAFTTERGVSGMLSYSYTDHDETKNHSGKDVVGKGRTVPDPLDADVHNVNGKIVYEANENNTFTFNASWFKDHEQTDLLGNRKPSYDYLDKTKMPPVAMFVDVRKQTADDHSERKAFSVTHDFALESAVADGGYWRAYAQQQNSDQKTTIDKTEEFAFRGHVPPNLTLQREVHDNRFKVRDVGIDVQLDKAIDGDSMSHELVYGVNYKHSTNSMQQHRVMTHENGKPTVDTLNKNGPDTTVNTLGIFAQDRITFGETGISVIPGLRYDYYSLDPKENGTFRNTVGNQFPTRSYHQSRISPRLGVLYKINEFNTLYANYSEGFRAPAFNETNFKFENYKRGYSLIANTDLRPETSRGIELGWRLNTGNWSNTLTGYYSRYKNFIALTNLGRPNPQTGLSQLQYTNEPTTDIYGVEWSSDWQVMDGLNVQTALAYSKGKHKDSGKPLNSIDPLNGVVSVNYDAPQKRWGAGTTFRASLGKRAKDINNNPHDRNPTLPSGGYGVWDVTGYYSPIDNLTLRAGVYNLFDKKYVPWSNAEKLSGDGRTTYTDPGRWFGASVRYEF